MMLKDPAFKHKTILILFCSDSVTVTSRLEQSLGELVVLVRHELEPEGVCVWVQDKAPDIVLLDFQSEHSDSSGGKAVAVATALQKACPNVPLAAVCRYSQPHSAVEALRAGVREIADLEDTHGLLPLVQRLTHSHKAADETHQHKSKKKHSVLLMGARAGMGVSTLTVHMASLWQERLTHEFWADRPKASANVMAPEDMPLQDRVGILDLGMPVGDCLLYMNLASDFHFVDAARNIQRLDGTLLRSALAHDRHGVSVLAWPRDLQQVHDVSHADSLLLYERLKEHFGLLLAEVGGFSNPRFAAAMAQSADMVLIVADQSVGALISLAELLKELEHNGIKTEQMGLVLNRYDVRYGMSASQIAERFGMPLMATLPDRALQMHGSMSQGALLHTQARRDPYVRALEKLIDSLMATSSEQEQQTQHAWWQAWRR